MSVALETAWGTFLELARTTLAHQGQRRLGRPAELVILERPGDRLRRLADELETSQPFTELCDVVEQRLPSRFPRLCLRLFLRNTRLYQSLFQGVSVDPVEALTELVREASRVTVKRTWLLPLGGVSVRGEVRLESGVSLRAFSAEELWETLKYDVRQAFSSERFPPIDDLAGFTYLCVPTEVELARETLSGSTLEEAWVEFSELADATVLEPSWDFMTYRVGSESLPLKVQIAIETLAHFDWGTATYEQEASEDWEAECQWCSRQRKPRHVFRFSDEQDYGFTIPFRLWFADSPLMGLRGVPSEISHPSSYETGTLDADEVTTRLTEIEREWVYLRPRLNRLGWEFYGVAVSQLVRGVMSTGLDALLPYSTVLEALLGDERSRTEVVRSRLRAIFDGSAHDGNKAAEQFKNGYKLRSQMVHGALEDYEGLDGVFSHVRQLARLTGRTSGWFLRLLANLARRLDVIEDTGPSPTREDLMTYIDLDAPRRARLCRLIPLADQSWP